MANKILETLVMKCATVDAVISAIATGYFVYTTCSAQMFHNVPVERFHQGQEEFSKAKFEVAGNNEEFLYKIWLRAVPSFFFFLINVFTSVRLALTASPEILSVGDKWKAAVYWLVAHLTFMGWTVIRDVALLEQNWKADWPTMFFIFVVSLYLLDTWEGRADTAKSSDKYFLKENLEKAMKVILLIDTVISALLLCVLIYTIWDVLNQIAEPDTTKGIIPLMLFQARSISKLMAWLATSVVVFFKICISGAIAISFDSSFGQIRWEEKLTGVLVWIVINVGYVAWTIHRDATILNEEWRFSPLVVFDIIGILVATVYLLEELRRKMLQQN